jgi:U4/U6 small nuclear ribonucleoprotein PRP4
MRMRRVSKETGLTTGRVLHRGLGRAAASEEDAGEVLVDEVSPCSNSLTPRAKARIARQRIEVGLPLGKIVNVRKEVFSELKTFNNLGSQFGDDRPLSTIRFAPNGKTVLTTSWTGDVKLWGLPNLNAVATKRGHTERVGGAAWHPAATIGMSEAGVNIASGGGEGDVKLWSLERYG